MATYAELFDLAGNSGLLNKVTVATVIAAVAIKDEATPVAGRIEWANTVLSSPESAARKVMYAVLAQAQALTVAQITAATD